MALAMLKLLTEGDLPEEDWKLLYAQDESGSPFEDLKERMRKAAPAFAYHLETSTKHPRARSPILVGTETLLKEVTTRLDELRGDD